MLWHAPTQTKDDLSDDPMPSKNAAWRKGQSHTVEVVLKITGQPGQPWWVSLGLPPPWRWGDDQSFAYVVAARPVLEVVEAEAA